ncbi:hypothetical protein AGMMS50276_05680 [Synergistales bacterium]|nr:hypothetical protein AGMMS50276_05680 [Synergistales bacterium]
MQDMFPFLVTVSGSASVNAKAKKSDTGKFDAKKSEIKKFDAKKSSAKDSDVSRYDARNTDKSERRPFESVLNQVGLAKTEKAARQEKASPLDNPSTAPLGDDSSKFSASASENSNITDISNAIVAFLFPQSSGLDEGIDLAALSTQVIGAMEEFLAEHPELSKIASDIGQQNIEMGDGNFDIARLKSALEAMKNRYSEYMASSSDSAPGSRLIGSAALAGLTASFLKKLQSSINQKQAQSEPSEIPTDGLTGESLPGEGELALNPLLTETDKNVSPADGEVEDLAAQMQLVSRLSAYLKNNLADVKASQTEKTGKLSSFDARVAALNDSEIFNAQTAVSAVQSAGQGETNASGSNSQNSASERDAEAPLVAPPDQQGSQKETLSSELKDKSKGYEDAALKASEDDAGSAPRTQARHDSGVNFEQFMNGVARRTDNAAPAPMELSHGTPLSQNETLRDGIENVVRFARVSGEQKASMIIDPPALGRIVVELSATATGLEASIKVSSEQVRQLIQEELSQLRNSLAQQGVDLTQFSVDVQQDDSRRDRNDGQQGGRTRTFAADDEQDEEASFRVDLDQGLLYWVA